MNKILLTTLLGLLFMGGCRDKLHEMERDSDVPGTRHVDFKVAINPSESGSRIIILFHPRVSNSMYASSLYIPRFEFNPENHGLDKNSDIVDLFNGLSLFLYDDKGSLISHYLYDTSADNSRRVSKTETYHYFNLGYHWDLDKNERYRIELQIPDVEDPKGILPEMHLSVGVPRQKFYAEHFYLYGGILLLIVIALCAAFYFLIHWISKYTKPK